MYKYHKVSVAIPALNKENIMGCDRSLPSNFSSIYTQKRVKT